MWHYWENDEIKHTGTYKECMKKAAHLRWLWITTNGYNVIRVERSKGKIIYIVRAHWNMPAYTLCKVYKA